MSVLTNPAVIVLAVAAVVVLGNLALRLSGRHGRGCTCRSCFSSNVTKGLEAAARTKRGQR